MKMFWVFSAFIFLLAFAGCSDEAHQKKAAAGEGEKPPMENAATTTVRLKVSGMSCQGCVNTVEKALADCRGVVSSNVSLAENAAEITYDPARTNVDTIIKAIDATGYEASSMN